MIKCKKCGKRIDMKESPRWEKVNGKRRYFCNDDCFETFVESAKQKNNYEEEINIHLEDKERIEEEVEKLKIELKRIKKQKRDWKRIANAKLSQKIRKK